MHTTRTCSLSFFSLTDDQTLLCLCLCLCLCVHTNTATQQQGCEIGQQAFCLMSPTQRPLELGEAGKSGNLLTMFLTGPLMAFCLAAGNTDPSIQQLVDLQVRKATGNIIGKVTAKQRHNTGQQGSSAHC